VNIFLFSSYYIADGSKKRVTFDGTEEQADIPLIMDESNEMVDRSNTIDNGHNEIHEDDNDDDDNDVSRTYN
jgi:hypothetical protein